MDTYFLLSAVFFVLLILFQALQTVGEKVNKIANTYGVPKEKPQPYVKCEGREIRIKAIEKSPEYYAGQEQYNHYFDLFFSMEEDYVNYTECRP